MLTIIDIDDKSKGFQMKEIDIDQWTLPFDDG